MHNDKFDLLTTHVMTNLMFSQHTHDKLGVSDVSHYTRAKHEFLRHKRHSWRPNIDAKEGDVMLLATRHVCIY